MNWFVWLGRANGERKVEFPRVLGEREVVFESDKGRRAAGAGAIKARRNMFGF